MAVGAVGLMLLAGAGLVGLAFVLFASETSSRASGTFRVEENVPAAITTEPPFEQGSERKPTGDHWHVAFGVFVCDAFLPMLDDPGRDPEGIHTHGDGVIHVHPFTPSAAGDNATLLRFEEATGLRFDADELDLGGQTFADGHDCGGVPARVRFIVNGDEIDGDPSDYRFVDNDVIVLAVVPDGTPVPTLPWAGALNDLSDLPQA